MLGAGSGMNKELGKRLSAKFPIPARVGSPSPAYRINCNIRQYSTIRLYYAIRQCFLVRLESGQVYCSIRHCFI